LPYVQVMGTTILPLLIRDDHPHAHPYGAVLDEFSDALAAGSHRSRSALTGLAVAYTIGPPFGTQLVQWEELDGLGLTHRALRRRASESLTAMLASARLHGSPPAFMLSFHGVETSLLLADAFWDNLSRDFPGDLVVGAPARDVVIVTGSGSISGLAKARRCVDRVFFAGGEHLLTDALLVWRGGWEVFDAPGPGDADPFDDLWSPLEVPQPRRPEMAPAARWARGTGGVSYA
jgi:hypothetical protein